MKKILVSALLIAGFAFGIGLTGRTTHAGPPTGFQTTLQVGSGLDAPTGIGIAPDGRVFILQQGGQIKIYKNGALLPRMFDELPALADSDRGLLGIAFDPDWNTNHYVYFYYIGTDFIHRVVRFNGQGDIGTDGPTLIYESGSIAGSNHAGGTIQFGPDGKLYLGIGDSGNPPNAQNLSNPMGKVLRLNKDGTIPGDNPFVSTPGARPEIWAYGFRNPFRFQFDSATGNLYLGDVGESNWEEINRVMRGGNYGWPLAEGMCTSSCSAITNPIYTYPHATPGYSVTGGPVYHGSMFPAEYDGRLIFADYAHGFMKTLGLDSSGNATTATDFDTNTGSVVDMKIAPDGSLYYLTIFPGRLYRVTYTNGNQIPTAVASANVTSGADPLTVNFTGSSSSDPEHQALTYSWDFGDGTGSTEADPVKTYPNKGVFTAQLTVSDGTSQALAPALNIQVGTPPTINVTSPIAGQLYAAGDTIPYAATATDGDGNALGDTAFTREVIFHHNTHIHPFLRPTQSRTGTFTIPVTGESSADTGYEIIMTATDSHGLSTSKSINIFPKKSNLTFLTDPPNLQVSVAGIPQTTPKTIQAVAGFHLNLDAPDQQVGGVNYEFDHWSNGGIKTQTLTVPATDTTYTAVFREAGTFTGEYFTNRTLSGTPALVRQDATINFVWNAGSPDPSIPNDNFSVRWTKQQQFAAGRYQFNTSTDDGVRLYIDGQKIIDQWHDQGTVPYSAVIDLTGGTHEVKMEYYEGAGGAVAHLNWNLTADQPPPPPTYPDYKGEYFSNRNLSGTPALTRNDSTIDFTWNNGSPDPSIPNDNFSARWTKSQTFEQGTYQFSVDADDGVRLFIDGTQVIDQWHDQASTHYTATQFLNAGNHDIKIEYYEAFGGAVAKFHYLKTSDGPPDHDYAAQYWNYTAGSGTPAIPSTPPTLSRTDAAINFSWNAGSPDPSINPDHFVAQWTSQPTSAAGLYRFTATSDDGIKVLIDGTAIIDQWNDHASQTFVAQQQLTAGTHTIVVQYYENAGGAIAQFDFAPVTNPPTSFSAEYFDNQNLIGVPVLTRNDDLINFFWNAGSPDPVIPVNHFSARWQRSENFTAGDHTFTVTADDGVRLYVDDVLVIDQWHDQAATKYTKTLTLTGGSHIVKMEYYENAGGAVATLMEN